MKCKSRTGSDLSPPLRATWCRGWFLAFVGSLVPFGNHPGRPDFSSSLFGLKITHLARRPISVALVLSFFFVGILLDLEGCC